MEAGLSCEQLTAMIVLFAGIYEAGEKLSGSELVERAVHLASTMNADICYCSDVRERTRWRKETRKALIAQRKRRRGL
jgi:hypothetical protein